MKKIVLLLFTLILSTFTSFGKYYVSSSKCLNFIKEYEKCYLKAYWDSNGYSIGYGHHSNVKANDVTLPDISVKPFVRYGVGVRKSWGERSSGFAQTYITNGGRNGIGLQAGFRWAIGKKSSNDSVGINKTPELPQTKITLNNKKGNLESLPNFLLIYLYIFI